jgi:cysteine desulfurase/selenocysteine lyase
LDSEFGIEVRAGYHCSALVHAELGTQSDGTLRLSSGRHTTHEEVDYVLSALRSILSA